MSDTFAKFTDLNSQIIDAISRTLLGKETVAKLSLCALLARGHLLIEDIPGVGKTTLARILARVTGLSNNRIQFTNDLLPTDILGYYMYDEQSKKFVLRKGPIHAQILLADEINRASPKSQSALLEAMEERTVTLEGQTTTLPNPFFVIATQNPQEQVGVNDLPESQLDRFMFRISIGYPDSDAEKNVIADQYILPDVGKPLADEKLILELIEFVSQVKCSQPIIDYIQKICQESRHYKEFKMGLSPRAGIMMRRAAQAWAVIHNRDYIIPEDVQDIFLPVSSHRLHLTSTDDPGIKDELLNKLIQSVNVD